jgi:hypothetical protein
MVAPDEGWAVGDVGTILRWDGTRWSLYRSSILVFYGLDMLSATDGWIVGNHGVVVRWVGTTNPSPAPTRSGAQTPNATQTATPNATAIPRHLISLPYAIRP